MDLLQEKSKPLSPEEIERLQKKGHLVYRPVEEGGLFATNDSVQYERMVNGSIRRIGGKESKKMKKKERLKRRRSLVASLSQRKCLDCLTPIEPVESWIHEGVAPLCESCFDVRNNPNK